MLAPPGCSLRNLLTSYTCESPMISSVQLPAYVPSCRGKVNGSSPTPITLQEFSHSLAECMSAISHAATVKDARGADLPVLYNPCIIFLVMFLDFIPLIGFQLRGVLLLERRHFRFVTVSSRTVKISAELLLLSGYTDISRTLRRSVRLL
eukprot:1897590-Rhodomonas_salina.1